VAELQGVNIERRFVPLKPYPDGEPHFHIPKAIGDRYKGWTINDTFVDLVTGKAWMLVVRKREGGSDEQQ